MIKGFDKFGENTIYFVCDRGRAEITLDYAEEFLENKRGWNKIKIHDTYEAARKELVNGFYDDSDYAVIKIEDGIFYIDRGRNWRILK